MALLVMIWFTLEMVDWFHAFDEYRTKIFLGL